MKQIPIESLPQDVRELVGASAQERIIVTRGGEPVAVLLGIGRYDEEDIGYMTDPAFWEMIQQRRSETDFVTLEEVKAQLEADERETKETIG